MSSVTWYKHRRVKKVENIFDKLAKAKEKRILAATDARITGRHMEPPHVVGVPEPKFVLARLYPPHVLIAEIIRFSLTVEGRRVAVDTPLLVEMARRGVVDPVKMFDLDVGDKLKLSLSSFPTIQRAFHTMLTKGLAKRIVSGPRVQHIYITDDGVASLLYYDDPTSEGLFIRPVKRTSKPKTVKFTRPKAGPE